MYYLKWRVKKIHLVKQRLLAGGASSPKVALLRPPEKIWENCLLKKNKPLCLPVIIHYPWPNESKFLETHALNASHQKRGKPGEFQKLQPTALILKLPPAWKVINTLKFTICRLIVSYHSTPLPSPMHFGSLLHCWWKKSSKLCLNGHLWQVSGNFLHNWNSLCKTKALQYLLQSEALYATDSPNKTIAIIFPHVIIISWGVKKPEIQVLKWVYSNRN